MHMDFDTKESAKHSAKTKGNNNYFAQGGDV